MFLDWKPDPKLDAPEYRRKSVPKHILRDVLMPFVFDGFLPRKAVLIGMDYKERYPK